MIAVAAVATMAPAPGPRAQKALGPAALPFGFGVLIPDVGYKGGRRSVTATVAPAVGVGASKTASGSPVDETPVGEAVTEMALSTMPNAEQALSKPVQYTCRRTRRGCQRGLADRK